MVLFGSFDFISIFVWKYINDLHKFDDFWFYWMSTKNIDFLPYFYLEKYLRNCILFDSFDEHWLFEIPLLAGSILEFNLFIKNIQFITIFFTILKKLNTIGFIWELMLIVFSCVTASLLLYFMNTTSKNIDFLPYFYLGKIFQKLHIIWFIWWRTRLDLVQYFEEYQYLFFTDFSMIFKK